MIKSLQKILKRLFDLIGSIISLVIFSPIFLIVAILIKINSKGKVFFKYERVGRNGKLFYPLKFRTMQEGAIKKGLRYNVSGEDERITKVGKFLREWGLDELPQLFNVFKGDMSLVGPRPTFKYQTDKYTDFQKKRLTAKPGITGWALIHGRNLLSWEERIKYDVWYVDNWSLCLDFKILLKTIKIVLLRKGVYGKEGKNDPFV